jgi:hypothetical protein
MKAYLINATAKTVNEVQITGDIDEMNRLIGSDYFTLATSEENGDTVYVDEEGLLSLNAGSPFFSYEGAHQPFVGNGLVMGCDMDTGNSTNVRTPLETIRAKVKFLTLAEVRASF